MLIDIKEQNIPVTYQFSFEKVVFRKKKDLLSVHNKGKISVGTKFTDKVENGIEYTFKTEEYNSKEIKEPLMLDPVKWVFAPIKNEVFIRNKDNLRLIWNKYRDKYRRRENSALFLALERLYFNTYQGLENSALSECPHLPFFINYFETNLDKDMLIIGCNWLLLPLNIPLNTTFKVININNQYIVFDGWVSLDEETLDLLLTKERFREKAESYHFSKDFTIDSSIKVLIDKNTSYLHSAIFNLEINGEDGALHETMKYEISGEPKSNTSWILAD